MDYLKTLEEKIKNKLDAFRQDVELDHDSGLEKPFTIKDLGEPETGQEIARLLSGMLESTTLTSPVDSVIMDVEQEQNSLEISMTDSFAVIIRTREGISDDFDVLVKRGETVKKGQGLVKLTEEQLENSAFFVTGMLEYTGQEDELLTTLRVFGPFIPAPLN